MIKLTKYKAASVGVEFETEPLYLNPAHIISAIKSRMVNSSMAVGEAIRRRHIFSHPEVVAVKIVVSKGDSYYVAEDLETVAELCQKYTAGAISL